MQDLRFRVQCSNAGCLLVSRLLTAAVLQDVLGPRVQQLPREVMHWGHIGFDTLLTLTCLQLWTYRQNGTDSLLSLNHDCKNDCTCRTETMRNGAWSAKYLVMNPGCPVRGHSKDISAVAFSPDGSRVISGSSDKNVKIWDVETGAQARNPTEIIIVKGGGLRVFRLGFTCSKTPSKLLGVVFTVRYYGLQVTGWGFRRSPQELCWEGSDARVV